MKFLPRLLKGHHYKSQFHILQYHYFLGHTGTVAFDENLF